MLRLFTVSILWWSVCAEDSDQECEAGESCDPPATQQHGGRRLSAHGHTTPFPTALQRFIGWSENITMDAIDTGSELLGDGTESVSGGISSLSCTVMSFTGFDPMSWFGLGCPHSGEEYHPTETYSTSPKPGLNEDVTTRRPRPPRACATKTTVVALSVICLGYFV